MKPIRVIPVGIVDRTLTGTVVSALRRQFGVECSAVSQEIDPGFAFHPERSQYHSSTLLERLDALAGNTRVLGITSVDLYIPILTFVFGEAQLDGRSAIVSSHRLTQEFYGFPDQPALTRERLVKEAIHEVGHTYGLTHCDDYECVMAAAHSVEWLDLKGMTLCDHCHRLVATQATAARSAT